MQSDKKLYLYSGLAILGAIAAYFAITYKKKSDSSSQSEGDPESNSVTTGTGDIITVEQATLNADLAALFKKSVSEVSKQLVNKSVYSKLDNVKARSSNYVNNGWVTNLMANIPNKGTFLGNVLQVVEDKEGATNADGRVYKWFKILPSQPAKEQFKIYTNSNVNMYPYYVREDVIKLQK